MEQSIKPFVIKVGIVVMSIVFTGGLYLSYNVYKQTVIQHQHEQAQEYIQSMRDICGFKQLSDNETLQLSLCKDDYNSAQRLLLSFLDTRINFWSGKMTDLQNTFNDLQKVKNGAPYWDATLEYKYQSIKDKLVFNFKDAKEQHDFFVSAKEKLSLWSSENTEPNPSQTKA